MDTDRLRTRTGYTLLEIILVMFIMGLAIAGGMRLYVSAHRNQKLVTYKALMHQNAGYAVRRLVEALEEAGAGLPLTLPIVSVGAEGDSLSIIVNPHRRAVDEILVSEVNGSDTKRIKVDSAAAYDTSMALGYARSGEGTMTSVGITSVLGDTSCVCDSLILDAALPSDGPEDTFYVFNYRRSAYYRDGTNLYYGVDGSADVIAENIDSLNVTLLDSTETPITTWNEARFFRVTTRVTTGRSGRFADTVEQSRTVPFQNQ
jgi:hypothetical protein